MWWGKPIAGGRAWDAAGRPQEFRGISPGVMRIYNKKIVLLTLQHIAGKLKVIQVAGEKLV